MLEGVGNSVTISCILYSCLRWRSRKREAAHQQLLYCSLRWIPVIPDWQEDLLAAECSWWWWQLWCFLSTGQMVQGCFIRAADFTTTGNLTPLLVTRHLLPGTRYASHERSTSDVFGDVLPSTWSGLRDSYEDERSSESRDARFFFPLVEVPLLLLLVLGLFLTQLISLSLLFVSLSHFSQFKKCSSSRIGFLSCCCSPLVVLSSLPAQWPELRIGSVRRDRNEWSNNKDSDTSYHSSRIDGAVNEWERG